MDGSASAVRRNRRTQPGMWCEPQSGVRGSVPRISNIGVEARAHAARVARTLPAGAHLVAELSHDEVLRLGSADSAINVADWEGDWRVESVRTIGEQRTSQALLRKLVPLRSFLSATVISRSGRYGFVSSPKCGNTAVKAALWGLELSCGHCDPLATSMDVHRAGAQPGSPWLSYGAAEPSELAEALEKSPHLFAVVRNPFERALSAYKGSAERNDAEHISQLRWEGAWPPSFRGFLEALASMEPSDMDIHWQPLSYILQPKHVGYSRLLTTEGLAADFHQTWLELGADDHPALPRVGVSDFPVEKAYCARTEELVRKIYAEDFDLFGYSPDRSVRYADREKLWRSATGQGASRLVLEQLRAMS